MKKIISLLCLAVLLSACKTNKTGNKMTELNPMAPIEQAENTASSSTPAFALANLSLIPYPESVSAAGLLSDMRYLVFSHSDLSKIEKYMPWMESWPMAVSTNSSRVSNVELYKHDEEGYRISILDDTARLYYDNEENLRNCLATVLQLLQINKGRLPLVELIDNPKFPYRGMHLDVARHFFDVDEIKKYIDYLTFYRYNNFHWHLTEDQGWRVEIKQYPKLQEIAAYRPQTLVGHYSDKPETYDNKKYGGYYTQEQIKDVVAYAKARGVNVIPEIDLPGHMTAAIAAYPELSCHGKQVEVAQKWGIFFDILCPTETTFEFLENVFDEILEIFPSKYIHIGGDECPKEQWKESKFCQDLIAAKGLKDEHGLQSYFIQRIEKYINSKGRSIIGWDEILEGGLAPNATVMSWRGEEGGIEAANSEHDVIMTPTSNCYFDYYQSENKDEPLAIGGYLPYDKVYRYEIIPESLPPNKHKYILGAQGNIWTEYIPTFDKVEYMGLTRMATLAEVVWGRNSEGIGKFNELLFDHTSMWNAAGANMANHLLEPKLDISVQEGKGVYVSLANKLTGSQVFYKRPGEENAEELTAGALSLKEPGDYILYMAKGAIEGKPKTISYEKHLGNMGSISLEAQPAAKYAGNGPQSIINGIKGSDEKYGGSEWLGFDGDDMTARIKLKAPASNVELRFYKGEGQWIYLPSEIKIYDEESNTLLAEKDEISTESKVAAVRLPLSAQSTNLRIEVSNYGTIPAGLQGSGHAAWLFIDEIVIH